MPLARGKDCPLSKGVSLKRISGKGEYRGSKDEFRGDIQTDISDIHMLLIFRKKIKVVEFFFLFFKKSYIFCNLNLGASQKVILNEFTTRRKKGVFLTDFFLQMRISKFPIFL
jgi:hypothetical protein